ncbi:MAG TPA: hypothetical protein VFA35_11540, partial [Burkholderiaceae bacterium]|nr:hypothetical protein [Burkholderiaceae bacterium]
MPKPPAPLAAIRWLGRRCLAGWLALVGVLAICAPALGADAQIVTIDRAVSVQQMVEPGSVQQLALPVKLPDDWALTRPRFEGSVWYRTGFDRPTGVDSHELM